MELNVYLSGEIHTNWREEIIAGCKAKHLNIEFHSAVTDHGASDSAGDLLGKEEHAFWRDHKSAKINAIRTRTMLENCDVAVIRFGEQYKQWNAAFDAGYCAALGTPFICFHADSLIHPLKEVDAAAMAWATTSTQIVDILTYVMSQQ